MYNISDKASAIREVQRYLRTIMRVRGMEGCVVPDGIYDDKTRECVREFQIENGLPPTGVVDYQTFLLLYNEYRIALELLSFPHCILVLPDKLESGVVQVGEESAVVALIQTLLKALKVIYEDMPDVMITGKFDSETESTVKAVQRVYSLPETGIIDKSTWNAIASEYEKFINADM